MDNLGEESWRGPEEESARADCQCHNKKAQDLRRSPRWLDPRQVWKDGCLVANPNKNAEEVSFPS